MTPAQFRKLALSMPDAHEEPHFDRASFRIGTKIFATMLEKDATAMVRVSPLEELMLLLEGQPEVFFSFGGWTTKNCSLGIRLAKADAALLRELMIGSWAYSAPKTLVAKHHPELVASSKPAKKKTPKTKAKAKAKAKKR